MNRGSRFDKLLIRISLKIFSNQRIRKFYSSSHRLISYHETYLKNKHSSYLHCSTLLHQSQKCSYHHHHHQQHLHQQQQHQNHHHHGYSGQYEHFQKIGNIYPYSTYSASRGSHTYLNDYLSSFQSNLFSSHPSFSSQDFPQFEKPVHGNTSENNNSSSKLLGNNNHPSEGAVFWSEYVGIPYHHQSRGVLLPDSKFNSFGCGDDAAFVSPKVLGVGDGVGGWSNIPGADPALFSRILLSEVHQGVLSLIENKNMIHEPNNCSESSSSVHTYKKDNIEENEKIASNKESKKTLDSNEEAAINAKRMRNFESIIKIVEDSTQKASRILGSSTLSMVFLCPYLINKNMTLSKPLLESRESESNKLLCRKTFELLIYHLGDSGVMVIRSGKLIYRSREQCSRFNCPYQLGRQSDTKPGDAILDAVDVQIGDITILATDGLFDNLSDDTIVNLVRKYSSRWKPEKRIAKTFSTDKNESTYFDDKRDSITNDNETSLLSFSPTIKSSIKELGQELANLARESFSKKKISLPFMTSVEKAFSSKSTSHSEGRFHGSKADDISVIVGLVVPEGS